MPRGGVKGKAEGARRQCVYLVHPFHACHSSDMSFSDFYPSDLTDITSSSDDDEEFSLRSVKKTGAKKARRDQRSPYTITNPLRPPRSTSYSVRALYGLLFLPQFPFFFSLSLPEQIVDGSINLDPDYQRGTSAFHPFHRRKAASPSHRCCLAGVKTDRSH